jgi:hypothetical protein
MKDPSLSTYVLTLGWSLKFGRDSPVVFCDPVECTVQIGTECLVKVYNQSIPIDTDTLR